MKYEVIQRSINEIIANSLIQSSFYPIFRFPLTILQSFSFNIQKTVLNTTPLFPYLNFDRADN